MIRRVKFLIIALLALCTLGLVSCGDDAVAPEGMVLARGGEEWGYNFYVPEGWTVSNYGEYASAYVSVANPTSVTFAEAEMPPEGKDGFTEDEIKAYFHTRMANLGYMSSLVIHADGVKAAFGNETENAYKFEFSYDYPREAGDVIKYRSLQYLIVRGDRLYIFQYASQDVAPKHSPDGRTYYQLYLEQDDKTVTAADVIAQFRFLDVPGTRRPVAAGSGGELVLVSDKKVAGFDFYAPKDSVAIASTALVHRDLGGGSSVSVSELALTVSADHPDIYFAGIKANMEKAFGTVTHSPTEKDKNRIEINGAVWGYFYEYSYSYAGEDFRGYTVIIFDADGLMSRNYYVFTYTAKADAYDKALADAMIAKLSF